MRSRKASSSPPVERSPKSAAFGLSAKRWLRALYDIVGSMMVVGVIVMVVAVMAIVVMVVVVMVMVVVVVVMVMVVMVKLIISYPRIRHDGDGANDGYDANDQIGPANHLLKHCKDCKDCPVSLSDCHVTFIDVMIFSFCERFSSVSQNH